MLLQECVSAIKMQVQVQVGAFKAFFKSLREAEAWNVSLNIGASGRIM